MKILHENFLILNDAQMHIKHEWSPLLDYNFTIYFMHLTSANDKIELENASNK